jgi:hypothetical protein
VLWFAAMAWPVALLLKPLVLFLFMLSVRVLAKGLERAMPDSRFKTLLFRRVGRD